jgi:hypothetical protein
MPRREELVKITAVETTVVRMPMRIDGPAPRMGGAPRTSMEILLVRVDTDEGVTGWARPSAIAPFRRRGRR